MTDRSGPSRRRVLRVGALAVGFLAGCAGGDPSGGPTGDPTATTDPMATPTTDPTATQTRTASPTASPTPALDLREANVVGVSVDGSTGTVRFDVTVYHDDDGEEGYANWWQVERLDGTRLGRRDLLHAHSTAPFTRSETVAIPDGVSCVVVRGHDRTHDYGGRAMLANLETGATRAVDQGPEQRSFTTEDCP
mgnify:CR=1 FL=1